MTTLPDYCNFDDDGKFESCYDPTWDYAFYTFFGWGGVAFSLAFANFGTAYGTAKSGMGIASMAVTRPHLAFKSLVPIIMAGILSIYGLIIAVLLTQKVKLSVYQGTGSFTAWKQFFAGITCGGSCVSSGYAIGLVGENAVRNYGMNENIFVAIILIMIFAEVLGLYGMIVAIIMSV